MSYLVLARKYRPQNFSELVGQEVLVRTLSNAIKNNRLHHAYMLHGIRGVGKTTTARIIAKTLNCLDDSLRNAGKACGICKNCLAISTSHHQDVYEIDAASRTGVDGIREIIDSIAYAPVMARYKIYIIDEVHMLSDQAFNALLKTLEEPPAHVKFIFATTEIRKVPQTILSRCQRFDLRRLDEKEILLHLKSILQKENFEAEEQALNLIAKASEGSVRDSLSMLDQALASNNHEKILSTEIVERMFGLSDRFKIIELLSNLLKGDFVESQKIFSELYSKTSDILQIANDLLEIIHKVTSIKLLKDYEISTYSQMQLSKIKEIANNVELNSLIRIWQLTSKTIFDINYASSPKIIFEMMLVRICYLIAIPDLKKVLIDIHNDKNPKENISSEADDDIVKEILKSFEGSKLC